MGRRRPPGVKRRKPIVPKSRAIADQRRTDQRAFDKLKGVGFETLGDMLDRQGE